MTPIEDLVRRALVEMPVEVTATAPLSDLDRRVRRARRRLAVGAGVAAAVVVAAVVVPLATLGHSGDPNSVGVANPHPTPSSEPAPPPEGTSVLWPSGAHSVAADSHGRQWLLYETGGGFSVGEVVAGELRHRFDLTGPADYLLASDNVVWVVWTGAGGEGKSGLTAYVPQTGAVITTSLDQVALREAVVAHDELYVRAIDPTGERIQRFVLRGDEIHPAGSFQHRGDVGEVAATTQGHVWVRTGTGTQLVELVTGHGSLAPGPTVAWKWSIYGPTGAASTADSLWTYDGKRIIGLTPADLGACGPCAEDLRLEAGHVPVRVVTAEDGSVFAVVGSTGNITFYSPQTVQEERGPDDRLRTTSYVDSLSPDPLGGVDYVDQEGRLLRWLPASSASR